MSEKIFLDLEKIRYTWENFDNNTTTLTSSEIEGSEISIGIISNTSIIKIKLEPKVLFFDVGNTLVHRTSLNEKFVNFSETDSILNKLKQKGIELGIISNGSKMDLNNLLADPSLLNRFRLVVMSQDQDVGGISKPKAKIFNVAIAKMSELLGFEIDPMDTAFLSENIEHFKAYNFLYTLGLKNVIRGDCREYIQ